MADTAEASRSSRSVMTHTLRLNALIRFAIFACDTLSRSRVIAERSRNLASYERTKERDFALQPAQISRYAIAAGAHFARSVQIGLRRFPSKN